MSKRAQFLRAMCGERLMTVAHDEGAAERSGNNPPNRLADPNSQEVLNGALACLMEWAQANGLSYRSAVERSFGHKE